MSLRWTLYVAHKHPQWAQKCKMAFFLSRIALHLKKVWYKVSLCEYSQWQSCKAFTGLSHPSMQKMVHVPYYVKICPKLTHSFKNADFQSIFVHSASAIIPAEKVNMNTKSTMSFFLRLSSLRWTVYVARNTSKGCLKNAKCPKFEQ